MAGIAAVVVLAPLSVAAWLAAYVGHFWQVGWLVSPKPIEPKLEKLSPISGFKRIVGVQGLVKGAMDLGKVTIAMGVATVVSWRMHDVLVVLPQGGLLQGFALIGRLMLELAMMVALALLILALLDYMFQKWKHAKDHRMSKQEVKDEHKDSEGDPRVKQRRMQFAQQIAMQRINQSVPTADVIVTNPGAHLGGDSIRLGIDARPAGGRHRRRSRRPANPADRGDPLHPHRRAQAAGPTSPRHRQDGGLRSPGRLLRGRGSSRIRVSHERTRRLNAARSPPARKRPLAEQLTLPASSTASPAIGI